MATTSRKDPSLVSVVSTGLKRTIVAGTDTVCNALEATNHVALIAKHTAEYAEIRNTIWVADKVAEITPEQAKIAEKLNPGLKIPKLAS